MSFPSDTQRGIPAWLAKFGPTLFRARYRASVGDSNAATKVPVIIQGAPSQTANLFECYDSAKNLLAAIDASGVVTSAGGVTNPSANSLAISTLVRGTNGQLLIGQTGAATAYETVTGDVGITAGGVTALASSVLKVVSVSLTNANIKNLRATPCQLVAAPAANCCWWRESMCSPKRATTWR
jgi:hypothetical protein